MRRYTSLRPLQPALWQTALESLASSKQVDSLGMWLQPQDSSRQSRTERAAILLGNLVEAVGPSLQVGNLFDDVSDFPDIASLLDFQDTPW